TLIAPSIGGALARWFGMENVFIITGVILFITTLLTIFLVKEDFQPVEKKDLLTTKEIFSKMDLVSVLIGLFVTSLILQLGIT
ncbi:MFS transporter, partial [Enterococcus faecalis]